MNAPRIPFLVVGSPDQLTGGYAYDRRIVDELDRLGCRLELTGLEGTFPVADDRARGNLDGALSACPDGATVVVDGLVAGGVPSVLEAHGPRLRLIVVVHHPLADETGGDDATRERLFERERRALAAATEVVVTSRFTAERLRRYGVAGCHVIPPGTDRAPATRMREGPPWRLLCVAAFTPRKGHDVLVETLARLRRHEWHCRCVGVLDRDPDFTRRVQAQIRDHELTGRIRLVGGVPPAELDAYYADSDLFVLPTRYEGYGMALAEALARGIPVIAGDGGAVRDTVPAEAGILVTPADVDALTRALSRFFSDDAVRTALRRGAEAARQRLPTWSDAARRFHRLLADAQR